jgi:monothiol glutaredoxin
MTDQEIREEIRKHVTQAIEGQQVMLFMKGTPDMPRCGFSARMVGMLDTLGADYAAMDILPDPRIREELSQLSGWPTIPQLFVDGQLVGGCDIATEMFESGELAEALGVEAPAQNGELKGEAAQAPDPAPRPIQIGE